MNQYAVSVGRLAVLLLLVLTGLLAGCQTAAPPTDPDPPRSVLPRLPDDGPGWSKYLASTTLTLPGNGAFSTSGEPAVYENGDWLTLDGDLAGEMAWAFWQFPLPEETSVEDIVIYLQQSPFQNYWVFWADYSEGRWVLDGEQSTSQATVTPPGPGVRSPGNYVYLALAVLPGNKINVDTMEFTHDGTSIPDDPIFDQFENNDVMADSTPLIPGVYRASIHDTARPDMSDFEEYRDFWDFYAISLTEGQRLTATLRFEVFNHFAPPFDFNDLDLLFFHQPTEFPLDDFDEDLSGVRIYYHSFEQIDYTAPGPQTIYLGIRGDFGDPQSPDNNAEYDLGIHLSDAVYEVSGVVTQEDQPVVWDYIVFLEPGNFNTVTPYPATGEFTITGVPSGTYDLKVASSARNPGGPFDYVWDPGVEVEVSNADVNGLPVDIGPNP